MPKVTRQGMLGKEIPIEHPPASSMWQPDDHARQLFEEREGKMMFSKVMYEKFGLI